MTEQKHTPGPWFASSDDDAHAILAEALSTPAAPELGAVKALEWEDFTGDDLRGGAASRATGILGLYQTYGDGAWSSPDRFHSPKTKGDIGTAKAAAQADFESRILSALVRP